MKRHIINLYTKDSLPKLIATLDVDSKFDVIAWLKANTDYQRKDVRVSSLNSYDDSIIDSERVYKSLNILKIKKY
jgi:hypothetical protein